MVQFQVLYSSVLLSIVIGMQTVVLYFCSDVCGTALCL